MRFAVATSTLADERDSRMHLKVRCALSEYSKQQSAALDGAEVSAEVLEPLTSSRRRRSTEQTRKLIRGSVLPFPPPRGRPTQRPRPGREARAMGAAVSIPDPLPVFREVVFLSKHFVSGLTAKRT